jgi:hypothetical protein
VSAVELPPVSKRADVCRFSREWRRDPARGRAGAQAEGLGRKLLTIAAAAAAKPLRISNIDSGNAGIARFLDTCGARPIVRQIEMCVAL